MRKSRPALLAAGAVAVLSGCSGMGLGPNDAAEAALACPKVNIVRDLQEVAVFRPGGKDLTDLESRAALVDYTGNCEYTSSGVTVNVNVFLVAERGPALQGNTAKYQYFVALAQPDDTLVSKAYFDTDVTFVTGQPRAGTREELAPKIPLPKDGNAKDWKIYLGFQLTPEQLEFNRTQVKK
ncbi:lipoprotein [Azospirillum lipoferum]|uniref:Lipoprotein n=1 Tax=Azospirillum lipoferum (strain 4B) TaxID=862719 RepID=G7Z6I1_AZOL4|nr:lipoprotein [Azospirillum lipoferum]CBS86564.1 conserved exported protein of unknown function, putative TAT domain [Azospirillum lipoferum 4B]